MLDIEIIKWGCGFADGYRSGITVDDREGLYSPTGKFFILPDIKDNELLRFESEVYPLFLTKVIEGINVIGDFYIKIDYHRKSNDWIYTLRKRNGVIIYNGEGYSGADKAKEEAIKYIYEATHG